MIKVLFMLSIVAKKKKEIHAAPMFGMSGIRLRTENPEILPPPQDIPVGPPSPSDLSANLHFPPDPQAGPPPSLPAGPPLPLRVALNMKAELHASALFAANGPPPPPQPIAEDFKEETLIPAPTVVQPPPDEPYETSNIVSFP